MSCDGVASALCSAGFQPAVSPTSSRQAPGKGKLNNIRAARRGSHALRIGNPRYSRLEACATDTRRSAHRMARKLQHAEMQQFCNSAIMLREAKNRLCCVDDAA